MIGYLKGEVLENEDGKILVSVGDRISSGAVGYSVFVPHGVNTTLYNEGQIAEFYIYTHVREEALDLYGFNSKFEKSLFLTLLSVNGVGPKSALGILSAVDPSQLVEAIIQGDQAYLTRIPGIGKKTAERVVVELRDSVKKKVDSGVLLRNQKALPKDKAILDDSKKNRENEGRLFEDATSALLGLGYREQQVQPLLRRLLEDSDVYPKKVEDLIRSALRQLS